MGACVAKPHSGEEALFGRTGSKLEDTSLISLERARALSSNAASVSSRYHGVAANGQRLRDAYEVFPRKVLGTGLSGPVVLAKGRRDGRRCALKRISKANMKPKSLKQLGTEVEIYLTLDHPNIARLLDVYETESEVALITECCEGGELYARLAAQGVYSEPEATQATRQMLRAVGYLHAHRIVHRDLKLENFLYEGVEASSPLKLIDFGFAKVWDPDTPMMASCGSIAYVSPDVLSGSGYTSQCDLWSLGVIVFMLLAGYPPFHGSEKEMRTAILAGKVDYSHKSRWKNVSEDAMDFVKGLLVKEPDLRLDVGRASQHRWLASPVLLGKVAQQPQLPKEAMRSLGAYARASHVKRAVLQLVAQELAPEDVRELRECFLAMDVSNEGTVRLSEFKDAIRGDRQTFIDQDGSTCISPTPVTPAEKLRRAKSEVFERLFEVLDANGDEQIYYSEFLAATLDTRAKLPEAALRAAFHRLDRDRSGTISVQDFKSVLGDTFEGVSVELLVSEVGKFGKKSGEGICYEEFRRLLEAHDGSPTPKGRRSPSIGTVERAGPSRPGAVVSFAV